MELSLLLLTSISKNNLAFAWLAVEEIPNEP